MEMIFLINIEHEITRTAQKVSRKTVSVVKLKQNTKKYSAENSTGLLVMVIMIKMFLLLNKKAKRK